jgi:regulator of cell morphogenesis and NO signaling
VIADAGMGCDCCNPCDTPVPEGKEHELPVDLDRTIASLVLERPSRARAFEQLGLDYCCGGNRSLADACGAAGLDPDTALEALDGTAEDASDEPDWQSVPLPQLVDHIVSAHHDRLRQELPRLDGLLAKVVRAHGDEDPQLRELQATFVSLRRELEEHMADEEARLFPLCRSGEPLDPLHVAELEDEHAATGLALAQLRGLTHGYDLGLARCNTHRATIDGLRELQLDLHRHIHEENNVLFARALASA